MKKTNRKAVICLIFVILVLAELAVAGIMMHNSKTKSGDSLREIDPVKGSEESSSADSKGLRDKSTIYSFLQGPVAWEKKYTWSGSWGDWLTDEGNKFGAFGCGLCCIANTYDTLSPYKASPAEVYKYARDNTSYSPNASVSAIGWEAMLTTLDLLGLDAKLAKKPKTLKKFGEKLSEAETAIILITSDNPDSYWGRVPGHYVNVWRYDPEDETVFITNSGGKAKNRKTKKLKVCYDHLKEASDYQVMYIYSYNRDNDKWRHKKIKDKWIKP